MGMQRYFLTVVLRGNMSFIIEGILEEVTAVKEFDLDKVKVAAVYMARMAEGRNPATNQPIDNELLNNPNVIRCLYYIGDILNEVIANKGIVGKRAGGKKTEFPVEVLKQFEYRRDKPISHVLKQFQEPLAGENVKRLNPGAINKWLCANGYIEKQVIEESQRECWFPLQKGIDVGMYAEERGEPGSQYATIMYSSEAQQFLAEHMEEILNDTANASAGNSSEAYAETQKQDEVESVL